MAFEIIYRRLFEVRLYHGYELNDPDSFFGMSETGKANEIIETNYDIRKYLRVEPTEACLRILKRYRLRFKTTSTGFFIGMKIRQSDSGAGIFRPAVPIKERTFFEFKLIPVSAHWADITNVKFKTSFPSKYYFGNHQNLTELNFPNLTLSPDNHNGTRAYEMGEIVENGGAVFQSLRKIEDGALPGTPNAWQPIQDNRWATCRDRRLVPLRFHYRFPLITGAEFQIGSFELRDLDDNPVRTFTVNESNPIKDYFLDFGATDTEDAIAPGLYNLVINGSDYQAEHRIRIDDELFGGKRRSNEFGIVSVGHLPDLEDFRLFEDNGDLRTEGGQTQTPVFEIRIKNRATYRAYILHDDQDESEFSSNADFVKTDRTLTTTAPIPLSRFYAGLGYSTPQVNFPDPSNLLTGQTADGNRWLSEIYLPRLNTD